MHISSSDRKQYTIVYLDGRLEASTVDDLSTYITTLIKENKIFLIIDCNELTYISSSGIGALLRLIKEIDDRSGKILFARFSPAIAEVITISGFDKILHNYKGIEEAQREMQKTNQNQ